MRGRLASEIIFQQWLQTQNRRHLSAWVVPTRVQHKGFSFYFWEDIMLCCVAVAALRLKAGASWPGRLQVWILRASATAEVSRVTQCPLRCLSARHLTASPLELCTGFSVGDCGCTGPLPGWINVTVWMCSRALLEKKRACVHKSPRKV